jgi:hypothetical protein
VARDGDPSVRPFPDAESRFDELFGIVQPARPTRTRYPGALVSTRSLPNNLRSCETYTCTALPAVSGGPSSQSASTSRSTDTTRFAFSRSTANTARCFAPRTSTGRPFSTTSSGPRIRNSTAASADLPNS